MEITKEELELIERCLDCLFDMTNAIQDKELRVDFTDTLADILGVILDIKED